MKENLSQRPESPEAIRDSVTQAGNRTLEALKGHLDPNQRSFYEGLLENLNGARAYFSKKGLQITSSLVLAATFLTSCAPAVIDPVIPIPDRMGPTATEVSPTASPTGTATETATPAPTETETPVPTETFAPMEISDNPEAELMCTYEDITSGRLAWNVEQHLKPFPEGAVNLGWDKKDEGGNDLIGPEPGSIQAEILVSFCKIKGDFLGEPDRIFTVATLQILGPDKDKPPTIVNFLLSNEDSTNYVNRGGTTLRIHLSATPRQLIDVLKKSKGRGIMLLKNLSVDREKYYNDHLPRLRYQANLLNLVGRPTIQSAISELDQKGSTDKFKRILVIEEIAPGYR